MGGECSGQERAGVGEGRELFQTQDIASRKHVHWHHSVQASIF